jgi:dethiobiotin synthetase
VCPQSFPLAAAPAVAGAVDLAAIDAAYARLRARHRFLVVEGAGGLLVPIAARFSMADLVARLALPLVVVARAALGTINHTRLTLAAAQAHGLRVAGVVISHAGGALPDADLANLALLRDELGALRIGEIPPLAAGELPDPERLDLGALISRACAGGSKS